MVFQESPAADVAAKSHALARHDADRRVCLAIGAAAARALRRPDFPRGAVAEAQAIALLHPDDQSCFAHMLQWVRQSDQDGARLLVQLRRPDGKHVRVVARITADAAGAVHVAFELDDVAAARRAEAQIRQIVESAYQAAVVTVGERTVYANHALARMLGYTSLEQMRAKSHGLDHVYAEDRTIVHSHAAARAAGRATADSYEFRLCRRDGSMIWVACYASKAIWNGEAASLAWLIDITDRKRAEAAQRRSEKLFKTVFKASPAMLTLSRLDDGRFIDVNEAFLRTLGYARDTVVGCTEREVGIFHDPKQHLQLARQAGRAEIIADVRTSDGQDRTFALSSEVLPFADLDMLLTAAVDVTDRRRHLEALRRSQQAAQLANRAKSDFLANMSHELRTPLNAIIGFSEVITREMFGPVGTPRYVEYARDILGSGQHLLQIINDLLDLSKLESGKQELHESKIALPGLVEASVRLVRPRAEAARLALRVEVPACLPMLRADERMLKQILINLLSNAIKFTPQGGVTVRAGCESGAIAIAVADTGIGMSAHDVELALAPFGQVDSGLSRKHEGTGLGLPLVRSLAELHGGRLEVRSTPGAGSTMTVRFPSERTLPS